MEKTKFISYTRPNGHNEFEEFTTHFLLKTEINYVQK